MIDHINGNIDYIVEQTSTHLNLSKTLLDLGDLSVLMEELELTDESNIVAVCSESFPNFDVAIENFHEWLRTEGMDGYLTCEFNCPFLLIGCDYLSVPGIERPIQISESCGVYSMFMNADDLEAFNEWIMKLTEA